MSVFQLLHLGFDSVDIIIESQIVESQNRKPGTRQDSFEELLARVSEEDATMQPIYLYREEAELTS